MYILAVMDRAWSFDFYHIFILSFITLQNLSLQNNTIFSGNPDIFFNLLEMNNMLRNLHLHRILVGTSFFFHTRNPMASITRFAIDQIDANNVIALFQFINAALPRCGVSKSWSLVPIFFFPRSHHYSY